MESREPIPYPARMPLVWQSTIASSSTRTEIDHRLPISKVGGPVVGFGDFLDGRISFGQQCMHVASQHQDLGQTSKAGDWGCKSKHILSMGAWITVVSSSVTMDRALVCLGTREQSLLRTQ